MLPGVGMLRVGVLAVTSTGSAAGGGAQPKAAKNNTVNKHARRMTAIMSLLD
jgi:hypothetical protein